MKELPENSYVYKLEGFIQPIAAFDICHAFHYLKMYCKIYLGFFRGKKARLMM